MNVQNSRPMFWEGFRCWILLSGGLDSAACVDFYKREGLEVAGLHVSYGQLAARHEVIAATAIARYYGISLTTIQVAPVRTKSDGEILGRNAFLLFTALMEIDALPAMIALGIHSGTPYYDCSPGFITAAQNIIDGQCDGRIRIVAPFLNWAKDEIWEYCLKSDVPVGLTYSCEKGLDYPCGVCTSCRDMEALRVRKKLNDPS